MNPALATTAIRIVLFGFYPDLRRSIGLFERVLCCAEWRRWSVNNPAYLLKTNGFGLVPQMPQIG